MRTSWNKGLKTGPNPEHSKRMKGRTPWSKGKKLGPHTEEWKEQARQFNLEHGIKPPVMKNEAHPEWKGEKVSYSGLHYWVSRKLGKPKECEHCGRKDAKKYEWANKSHEYKRDLNDWIRLCVPCHLVYDKNLNSIKQKYSIC